MQAWTATEALPRPEGDWQTAELEIETLYHDGVSFNALVFLNNDTFDEAKAPEEQAGFAGRFSVFGHGDCWGDAGHCEVPGPVSSFDHRPPHPLTAINISLDVTSALRAVDGDGVLVTVVAASAAPDVSDPLRFEGLGLAVYQ